MARYDQDLIRAALLGRRSGQPRRPSAAEALGRFDMSACREALLELVRDVEPIVASTARRALEGRHR